MTAPKLCPRCGDSYDDAVDFCAKDGTRLIRAGQASDLIGTVLAERYRITARIGEGGMGQVYLGEHVRMRRKSAIKIMRPGLLHEPEALQRFTREAENASQLSHPNIAAIFDFGETAEGVVYLAMEYVDGGSLADVLERDGALHPEVAADVIGQAADALQAAHDMQMLHRDIKPDNMMLGRRPDGTYLVKLVDFGIARTYGDGDQKVTRTGYAVGTPQYMSPEQLAGESLDARSDQYSLGLVAFYTLTGKQAFPSESTKESLIMRLTSRPQTLQAARQDVEWPEMLQAVFNQALAPEPGDRFGSVLEFAEALSMAITSMTPTQTAELYRRALDARAASVVARTPGAVAGLAAASGERSIVSRSGSGEAYRVASASGSTPPVASAPRPAARWPFIIGGVAVVSVAATLFVMRGGSDGGNSVDSARSLASADSSVGTAISAADTDGAAPPPPTGTTGETAGAGVIASAPPGTPTGGTATKGTAKASATTSAKATADSLRKARDDSAKRASAVADSLAEAASARARYPEAPARAMIARGIDARAYMARNDDVRAVIMPTPMFVWRAEQAQAWKSTHVKPEGGSFDIADPIEHWSQWSRLVNGRRAVYVLEVTAERVPWPTIDPTRVVDFKRGDVVTAELLRDGAPVSLEQTAPIIAVADEARQQSGGKPVFHAFVAVLAPNTFIPRDDGSMPKFELRVRDASRPGETVKIGLSESLVKRLYNAFAPWRDALTR